MNRRSFFRKLWVLGIVFISNSVSAEDVIFSHVSFAQGLVNSSISGITQDQSGFLWFGTQAGLQRYDGYGMQLYTAEPFNRNSLSNQLVQTIHLAPGHVMWVGTYGGLNRLNFTQNRVENFTHVADDDRSLSNSVVTSISGGGEESIWVATLGGLNRLDDESEKRFSRFLHDPDDPESIPSNTVRSTYRDDQGRLWIGSLGGLTLVENEESRVPRFRTFGRETDDDDSSDGSDSYERDAPIGGTSFGSHSRSLVSPYVMDVTGGHDGELWLGVWDGGLVRFVPETGFFEHVSLPDNRVYTVMVARDGLVYAGTWGGGLYVFDPEHGTIDSLRHDPDRTGSLAHDVVYSLFEDRSGIIWIGTNGNGISKYDRTRKSFRYIHRELPADQRLDSGKIYMIQRDPQTRDLYVGLQNNGLNVVNDATGVVTRYRHDPEDPMSISSDTVNGILRNDDGSIYIATHAGVNRFVPPDDGERRGRFSVLDGINDPIVYQMIRDRQGTVWFGTYNSGVYRKLHDGTFRRYENDPENPRSLTNNLVYDLYEDSGGDIWIATNGGLNRYEPDSDDFFRYVYDPDNPEGLSSLNTGNLLEDESGTLWIGTRSGGLNRLDRETDTFSHVTVRDGLSSNTVTGILEGEPGVLYVTTPNGLNRVDTETGEVTTIDERDGLHVREFSTGAFKDSDGTLLFGAFSEVVRVDPRVEEPGGIPPNTVITEVQVLNQPVDIQIAYSSEDRETPLLELTHEENFLSFAFSTLSYELPERNRYRYRLRGFDSEWVDAGSVRTATYTNVPPGVYEFEVIGSDARGVPSLHPASIRVRIHPPYWRTPWFVGLMVVISVGVVVAAYMIRVRTLQRANHVLEATVSERTARLTEANEVKDRFFSIIAHDLRGPVAGIENVVRNAKREVDDYGPDLLHEIFETLHSTSQSLLNTLENLLEWARIQSGGIELVVKPVPVLPLLRGAADLNGGALRTKELELEIACVDDAVIMADENMTRVVIENLLSNAIKFTPLGGFIRLACAPDDSGRYMAVVVRDTGAGIPAEKIEDIFRVDNRYRTRGTAGERGSGFGLSLCDDLVRRQQGKISILSEPGSGTTVTILLPRG